MDLILQAIKSLLRKAENAISQTTSALSKRIDAASTAAKNAKTEAAAANEAVGSKMNANNPVGTGSFSMGRKYNSTVGQYSHAEGLFTTASGKYSHAEGYETSAHSECSHAEGYKTSASDEYSHAEGYNTSASGQYSHAEGCGTKASRDCSHVEGKYNILDSDRKYLHIVGNGSASDAPSNAHTLDGFGVPWYQGRPQFGGNAQDDGSQTVMANGDKELIITSSTEGSTKQFKITVDDSGTITATEVTA